MISTFVTGILLTPLWLVLSKFNVSISLISLVSVLGGALVYVTATVLYFKAMQENDASIISIMFQMIPVFSYILALILFKENLTIRQIIGSVLIIFSAIIISFNFKEKKNDKKKLKAFILMTLSSLLYATYFILFDVGIRHSEYYSCAFWYQIGFLIIGLVLLCIKGFRKPFFSAIKKNGKRFLGLNSLNELFNLGANLIVNFANVTIPVALVNVLTGFQGAFAFILGILGTIFVPKYIKEDLSKSIVIQKVISIVVGIIGLIILVYK